MKFLIVCFLWAIVWDKLWWAIMNGDPSSLFEAIICSLAMILIFPMWPYRGQNQK
jgi:hypothetical protein